MNKRLFDIALSLVGLILGSPLFLIIYIGIKCSCKGSIIFKQERIGLHGKPFNIYKFRTMVVNNEQNGLPMLAEPDDQRLTKIGKFLRAHHLDELPQLWNVLKGDMSFIALNVNTLSTRLWSMTPVMNSSTACDQASPPMPRFTTAIQTPWKKCSEDLNWICITWSTSPVC